MTRRLVLLLALALAGCRSLSPAPVEVGPASTRERGGIVILISIDGWRHDYLDRFQPPTLSTLARTGVRAEGLIPQFPSKTFPNHYTMVTGLRPAHHGIVSNNMIAPDLPGRFALSNRDVLRDPRWWGGEPVWNTVERQGGVAAAMFWPGSETAIGGGQPRFWLSYDDAFSNDARVRQILEWLRLPQPQRPSFLTLYFSDVDTEGHNHGPDSKEVKEAALRVDGALGEMVAGVRRLGLEPLVNYVIVSDHGMAETSPERRIVLDDYIDLETVDVIDWTPVLALSPRDGDAASLSAALKGRHPALAVFMNAEIPSVYGLAGHPRVAPVIGIADEEWTVTSRRDLARWEAARRDAIGGNHGYDPRLKSMQGLFIASGPAIVPGLVVEPFENIHVYEMLCALLGVEPAANDGDPDVTRRLLR